MRILFLEHCIFFTYFPVEITEMRTPADILATYCCFVMHTPVQELINYKAREISVLDCHTAGYLFVGNWEVVLQTVRIVCLYLPSPE